MSAQHDIYPAEDPVVFDDKKDDVLDQADSNSADYDEAGKVGDRFEAFLPVSGFENTMLKVSLPMPPRRTTKPSSGNWTRSCYLFCSGRMRYNVLTRVV